MDFSIIVASFDRAASLERLLAGVAEHFVKSSYRFEVLVANNARDESVARQLDGVIAKFAEAQPERFRRIREAAPGKCRAQNRAIAQAQGKVLVFFDDDVQVTPNWLDAAGEFFHGQPHYHAMQGPILMPEPWRTDEKFLRLHRQYRTINFVQYPETIGDLFTLTGANMAMRREVFDKVGLFNEALGPGCSGISEDVEFAQRLTQNGLRIGYQHKAGVLHDVDLERLSEKFFRQRHEQQGRSRLIYKKQSMLSIVSNLTRSTLQLGCYSVIGDMRKKYRAKGRYFHYRAMLSAKMQSK